MRDAAAPAQREIKALAVPELVAMVAALSALNALAIDIMLPALPDIGASFGLDSANDRQLVVVVYVLLFGVSQLIYGPLADAYGRRSVLVWALGLYCAGSVLAVIAPSFGLFLAARALQGVGAAATRVIATSVVRDLMEGRRMAQVMSMAMTVFMIVPIVAPSLGQLVLFVAPWRWIFGALLVYALLVLAWTFLRLPETLAPERRRPFRAPAIIDGFAEVLRSRQTVGYMMATLFMAACLFGYITCSEQIFVDVFGLGEAFPLAFGSVAIAISIGNFLNSRFVVRFGMRRISHLMALVFTVSAAMIALVSALGGANFWVFTIQLACTFALFGLVSGNFNALAMQPAAHVAGSASALYGAVTATGGAIVGGLIGRGFDGTVAPFALGLTLSGAAAILCVLWTERGKLMREGEHLTSV